MTERYHYTACGLDYVYLLNGFTVRETPHGGGVSIKDARGLHEAIARSVIGAPHSLRGQEVRFLRAMLKLSQDHLARVLRQRRGSVARWEASPEKSIPGAADSALRMFYALKSDGHEVATKLIDLLQELDELEHSRLTRDGRIAFREAGGEWQRSVAPLAA